MVPKVNVLVTLIVDWKQPVPDPKVPLVVYVKPVAVAILNTVVPSVACARTILVAPKAIALVFVLLELKVPVVKLNPFRVIVPLVSVVVSVTPVVSALPKLHPPPIPSKVIAPFIVVPPVVIVLPVVVELNVMAPVLVQVIAINDIEPLT